MKKTELLKYLKSLPGEQFVSETARLLGEGKEIPASMIKRIEEYHRVLNMREFDLSKGKLVAGIDEAGRGPLAGHVYAAAVILPDNLVIEGINDSKKLSEKKREELYEIITEKALAYKICYADSETITEINIRNATLKSMKEAEKSYLDLLECGVKPETARSVLPTCLKAEIVVTANLREWRHIFHMRTSSAAHPDIRMPMRKLCQEFRKYIPVVFDDITWD